MHKIDVAPIVLDRFGSSGATIHHPLDASGRLFTLVGACSIVVAQLDENGVIGRHGAVGEQLLVVTAGQVIVSGGDGARLQLGAGEAVQFYDGEEHETRALTAATVVMLQTS